MYYTDTRATANFNENYVTKSTAELTDGTTVLHSTDTLIPATGVNQVIKQLGKGKDGGDEQ